MTGAMLMPRFVSRLQQSLVCQRCLKVVIRRGQMTSSQARKTFLDYFIKDHNHVNVPSSSVLPSGDSTLLFTTAGMNQFKPIFLENSVNDRLKDLKRAANSQKCIRVGGKHNDFDDVGKDGYHHTFFEMLGNWSFGDYFKKEACEMAWRLLTGPYRIPPEHLYVTYFGGDAELGLQPDLECREIWKEIGVSADRLLPFGMRDNFWDMGDTGPCGPCTEIHYSHLPLNEFAAHLVNSGSPKVIELWNLVFIQYCRKLDGSLEKLRRHHVDTGMGLERLSAVLNNRISNYDTDLFQPLFSAIQNISGCPPYTGKFGADDKGQIDTAYRIIADHVRMATVSIADGLLPDEVGPGHCLRRVIRRATMASILSLKSKGTLTSKLVPVVSDSLCEAFENIPSNLNQIVRIVGEEEARFMNIINNGIRLFKKMTSESVSNAVFPAQKMGELHFVHGIPEEFILDLIASKGLIPELDKFHELVAKEKLKSQKAYQRHLQVKRGEQIDVDYLITSDVPITDDAYKYNIKKINNKFHVPEIESKIVAIWDGTKFVKEMPKSDNTVAVVTKETNFYAEAGGQVADIGFITNKAGDKFEVTDVYILKGYVVHKGRLLSGCLRENDEVSLAVNSAHREGCMRNHTATHLLNSVLRQVLGKTEQRSSKVAPDYLRFDFTAESALSSMKLAEVEKRMSEAIERELIVKRLLMPFTEANKLPGFVTIPGESYPNEVAVIGISDNDSYVSLEPCCGTHLSNTRDICDFQITSQKSQGQSVRSLRAVVGPQAIQARKIATTTEKYITTIASEIETKDRLNQDLFSLHQRLTTTKMLVNEGNISILLRDVYDKRIEELQRKVIHLTKTQIKAELNESFPTFQDNNIVVHLFKTTAHEQVVFNEAVRSFREKPCFWFVRCENKLHGRCVVDKGHHSDRFNAEIWASFLIDKWAAEGKVANKLHDYSVTVEINDDTLSKIIESTKEYGTKIYSSNKK